MDTRIRIAAVCAVIGVSLVEPRAQVAPQATIEVTTTNLTASNPAVAACLPNARAHVAVDLTTAKVGFDRFEINASGLVPNQDYTVFLLEQPGSPFGAAEYIGDFSTNGKDMGLAAFAAKTLPAVEMHLTTVKALDKSPADDVTKAPS